MKRFAVLLILFASGTAPAAVWMWPDYFGITMPPNIAPLNFKVAEKGEVKATMTAADGDSIAAERKGESMRWPAADWRRFLKAHAGEDVLVAIACAGDRFVATNRIARAPVDSHLTYRLIPPGYTGYAPHGIYQRDLTSFEERPIYRNLQGAANQCVNCHTLNRADPEQTLFHARVFKPGTQIFSRKWGERKVDLLAEGMIGSGAYPAWHPSGDFIAFSLNETRQGFRLDGADKIEVIDVRSDMVVYCLADNAIVPVEVGPDVFETYPTWSPDGKWLFSASARTPFKEMPENPDDRLNLVTKEAENIFYDLVVRSFDPATRKLSAPRILVDGKASNKSVSFPRVSPDGRWLVMTVGPYGNFHVWHHDADLWIMDLSRNTLRPAREINSPESESYHTFSHDGKWMVFSSRRDDGVYTRPYFTLFDAETGNFTKPFLIPVEDPDEHVRRMLSYNVPEFANGPIRRSPAATRRVVESDPIPSRKGE